MNVVETQYGEWVNELLRARCEDAGLIVVPMDVELGDNFVAPCDMVDNWVGEEYKIMLGNKDHAVELLNVVGRALREHGGAEQGGGSNKASIVNHLLGELYPMVEGIVSDYVTVETHYGGLLDD